MADETHTLATGEQPCPFCDGTYAASAEVGPAQIMKGGQVVHSMPPCKTFLRLPPVEYMKQAREARGIPLDN